MRNGATICRSCHDGAHAKKENREWFVRWVELNLDEEGFYKFSIAKNPDVFLP